MYSKKYHIQLIVITLLAIGVVPLYKYAGIFNAGWLHYSGYLYLLACIILFLVFARNNGWSWKSLGFRLDNLGQGLQTYFIFTAFWVVIFLLIGGYFGRTIHLQDLKSVHFLGMFLISAILQELFFRSLLVRLQREIFQSKALLIFYNALLFSFIHLVFTSHVFLITMMTFLLGLGFVMIYLRYENFFLVAASHAIINFVGIGILSAGV